MPARQNPTIKRNETIERNKKRKDPSSSGSIQVIRAVVYAFCIIHGDENTNCGRQHIAFSVYERKLPLTIIFPIEVISANGIRSITVCNMCVRVCVWCLWINEWTVYWHSGYTKSWWRIIVNARSEHCAIGVFNGQCPMCMEEGKCVQINESTRIKYHRNQPSNTLDLGNSHLFGTLNKWTMC